ncbi:Lrp/AsnC family transcriptional regulator [Motiliproteus sp. MSK22-1]|uniref:Lrp/AsnC family transcriptional regulator n=1 Tax=Motiliproteus sp. MSK22-1 TaxID=1897630 RepID=UPI0009784007|nr:Lrp/AsnC family transcriptional regulator [Motiliproteus sp. MSK22-1]OMH27130.1 hypothetical protein BGP75_22705 [Motiliproteus sp. MSK22-1]
MDKFDQAIVSLLNQNARLSLAQIGRDIGLSRTSVAERLQRLEETGTIAGYTIKTKRKDQPGTVNAYFQMTFSPFKLDRITRYITEIPEIQSCRALSGEIDLIAYVEAESMERLNQIRNKLQQLPDLQRLLTCPVLEDVK